MHCVQSKRKIKSIVRLYASRHSVQRLILTRDMYTDHFGIFESIYGFLVGMLCMFIMCGCGPRRLVPSVSSSFIGPRYLKWIIE